MKIQEFISLSDEEKSKIKDLLLSNNDLSKLTTSDWETLNLSLSKCTSLNTILLNTTHFYELSLVGWEAFGKALSQCRSLQTLDLHLNSLSKLNVAGWEAFGKGLSQCHSLQTLDLSLNWLRDLSVAGWKAFGEALSQCRSLQTLDFGGNRLDDLNVAGWETFGKVLLQCRSLQSLNLSNNHLQELNVAEWEAFGKVLSQCRSLQTLDFGGNRLNELNDMKFKVFCKYIKKCSQLTKIKGLESLSDERKLKLEAILKSHEPGYHFKSFSLKDSSQNQNIDIEQQKAVMSLFGKESNNKKGVMIGSLLINEKFEEFCEFLSSNQFDTIDFRQSDLISLETRGKKLRFSEPKFSMLISALKHSEGCLKNLYLSENYLGELAKESIDVLSNLFEDHDLKKLDLSNNLWGKNEYFVLQREMLLITTLEEINLSGNDLGKLINQQDDESDDLFKHFLSSLIIECPHLKTICLNDNNLELYNTRPTKFEDLCATLKNSLALTPGRNLNIELEQTGLSAENQKRLLDIFEGKEVSPLPLLFSALPEIGDGIVQNILPPVRFSHR